jgi:hypothetical protein
MRDTKIIALVLLPLLGCYAQIEDQSVTMTQSLCSGGSDCIPGGGASLTLIQVSGSNTYTVPFGDQPLLQPSNSVGPTTINTSLVLNQAALDLTTSSPASFNNVTQVTVWAVHPGVSTAGDPCATSGNCTAIATYTQNPAAPADRQLTLNGNGSDLVTFIDQSTHNLTIEITASGQAPTTPTWNANVSMDMALKARANFP